MVLRELKRMISCHCEANQSPKDYERELSLVLEWSRLGFYIMDVVHDVQVIHILVIELYNCDLAFRWMLILVRNYFYII